MQESRIIEKMKKLLALSESTANENEAMIATKQLHIMLAKHNISMGELNKDVEDIGEEGVVTYKNPWRRQVAMHVANLYFCSFYYQTGYGDKVNFIFVGSQANRTFALHIFTMIIKAIEKAARKGSRERYGKEVSSFFNSFCIGAMQRIGQRCNALIEDAKQGKLEDEQGNTLPALLSTYDSINIKLDEYLSPMNLEITKDKINTTDFNAIVKGREAGDKVQLSRSIQGTQSPKLLG